MISVTGGWDAQPSRFLGKSDYIPTDCMATTVVFGASPEEITAQFVDVVANFLRKERSLHCIGRDRSDRSFNKGGLTSYRQIFGLPSLNTLSYIFHQVLV